MYSWINSNLEGGIVGGSLVQIEGLGVALGNLALRVHQGEDPDSIPETGWDSQQYQFDWRQMKHWNIGIDKIPAGSMVINGEYSVWELYKWRIVGLIVLILLESALIVELIRLTVAQKSSLKQQAHQREKEALVAQLAAAFINLPAELVNQEIEKSFQRMLDFFELDRISLFEYSAERAQLRLLCFRVTPGAEQPPSFVDLPTLSWTGSQILRGAPVVISSVNELPEDASALREVLRAVSTRSFIAFPLRSDEHTFATLTLSTVRAEREWNSDLVQTLRTIADIFCNALERKYAEEAVLENRNRLNNIIESAMDAIIVVDSQQHIVVFNDAAEKLFGYPVAEVLGLPLERLIPHRFRARDYVHVSRFAKGGANHRLIGTLRGLWALRANGKEFPIEVSISRVETHGETLITIILRDVTERERALQALRESEQLKASILDSLSSHVAVVDSSGIVVAVTEPKFDFAVGNRLLLPQVGANYFEICGSKTGKGDPETSTLEGMQEVFDGKRDYYEVEYAHHSATEQLWLLMSVTPLKVPGRGIVITHHDITERKRHEQAIQELSGRLINAQEQERSRIARELHDDINQRLAILAIELQQLGSFISEDSVQGRERVEGLWRKAHGLSTDLQHLSHQLHSTKLDHLGIIPALRALCSEFSEQHKIGADFQSRQVPMPLDSEISLHLFRVAQESLHNVAKHSRAKRVRMEIVGTGGKLVLRISDDGIGFDADASKNRIGLGMTSMNERIRYVGGTLSVWSKPSMGTQVEATIPLSQRTVAMNRESVSRRGKVG